MILRFTPFKRRTLIFFAWKIFFVRLLISWNKITQFTLDHIQTMGQILKIRGYSVLYPHKTPVCIDHSFWFVLPRRTSTTVKIRWKSIIFRCFEICKMVKLIVIIFLIFLLQAGLSIHLTYPKVSLQAKVSKDKLQQATKVENTLLELIKFFLKNLKKLNTSHTRFIAAH